MSVIYHPRQASEIRSLTIELLCRLARNESIKRNKMLVQFDNNNNNLA